MLILYFFCKNTKNIWFRQIIKFMIIFKNIKITNNKAEKDAESLVPHMNQP